MAHKTAKKDGPKRSARRKVVAAPNRKASMDSPEVMPDYDVNVKEMSELLVRVEVTNLNTGKAAISSCGPKDDVEAIVEDLKVRLYSWS